MKKHTFLTIPVGHSPGLTSVSIGLFRTLDRLGVPVGFYKPLGQPHPGESVDRSCAYLQETGRPSDHTPIKPEATHSAIQSNRIDDLMEQCVKQYAELPEEQQIMVVEGMVPTADLPSAHTLNAALARALSAEVILVTRPEASTCQSILQLLDGALNRLPSSLLEIKPAVILNHIDLPSLARDLGQDPEDFDATFHALRTRIQNAEDRVELVGLVATNPDLAATRVIDIAGELGGEIIHRGDMHKRRVRHISLCARTVANMLHVLKAGTLVVTPADRDDIIIAAAQAANRSIHLAGLVLTGDTELHQATLDFCRDAFELDGGLPIFRVPTSSFETAKNLTQLNPEVPIEDTQRINLVMDTVARGIDADWLRERCSHSVASRMSPPAFRHHLSKTARSQPQTIVLPEGEEPRTIQAAARCAQLGLANTILLGDPDQIRHIAEANDLHLPPEHITIQDPADIRHQHQPKLMELRAHKGITEDAAREALQDNIVLGTLMLAQDHVHGLVAGAINSTAATVRPALQLIKTAPEAKAVSSIFFMCLPDQVLVYGDCAVNPDPDAELLADIALQSAASAKAFGIEPIVAMISYSTLGSGSGANVDKVKQATALAKEKSPDLTIDGPLQYDAASNMDVAKTKAPDSQVAGRANVFIFPDLNTGNTTYKAVQRSANVISIGPMLQGLAKPVNDLSRGASVDDIVYTIALTAIQSQQQANE